MRSGKHLLVIAGFFVLIIAATQRRVNGQFVWPYPPINELVPTEHFAGDVGALLLGSHRTAADIAYIQLLQYYGVSEEGDERETDAEHAFHYHDESAGVYARLKEFGQRMLRLDPFFNAAILDVAGALAFNQKRIDESLEVLNEAIRRDPTFYRYHLYVAAILYKNQGKEEKLIEKLLEAIKYPDCPPLLQGLLGNLLRKYGRNLEAANVYLHTYQTVQSASERNIAKERLMALLRQHPELIRQMPELNDF